jgi:hypothetical protein
MYSPPGPFSAPESPDNGELEWRFALLARLLMEIERRVAMTPMQMKSSNDLDDSAARLQEEINKRLLSEPSESRRSYLEAVQACLEFQTTSRRRHRQISTH